MFDWTSQRVRQTDGNGNYRRKDQNKLNKKDRGRRERATRKIWRRMGDSGCSLAVIIHYNLELSSKPALASLGYGRRFKKMLQQQNDEIININKWKISGGSFTSYIY